MSSLSLDGSAALEQEANHVGLAVVTRDVQRSVAALRADVHLENERWMAELTVQWVMLSRRLCDRENINNTPVIP